MQLQEVQGAPTIPATGDAFLDRQEELNHLARTVLSVQRGAPRWLALVGPRKVGKTSLLAEWRRRTAPDACRWAAFDFFADPPSASFVPTWAARIADAALGSVIGRSLEPLLGDPDAWRTALLGAEPFRRLPVDLQSWLLGLPGAPRPIPMQGPALDLPERLAIACDCRIVVVLDEFQELLQPTLPLGDGDLPKRLRAAWQTHQNVTYVIAGSAQATLEQLVTSRRSAFFDHFELMRLGPLPAADAAILLTRVAGRRMAADAEALALRTLGGHPFHLHAVGAALARGQDEVGLDQMKIALQSVLFSSDGRLALFYERTRDELVGRSGGLAAVLDALAAGPRRLGEIARSTGASTGATAASVRRLGEAVVHAADGGYRLADPVFGAWLRWRGPGGTLVPMSMLGDEGERRAAEALAARGFGPIYFARASRGAFDLIAQRHGRMLGLQVKRTALPYTLKAAERARAEAEAAALRIPWVLAVAPARGEVQFFASTVRGRASASDAIENLPRWFDQTWTAT